MTRPLSLLLGLVAVCALAGGLQAAPGVSSTLPAGVARPRREAPAVPATWGRARQARTVLAGQPAAGQPTCPPVWEWAAHALRLGP